MSIVQRTLRLASSLWREHIVKPATRSSHWGSVRKEFLKAHGSCAACGSSRLLQVHHKVPFHTNPELELDPNNFITLCMDSKECHIHIGHGGSFKMYNPGVQEDAVECLQNPDHYSKIVQRALVARKVNEDTEE